jgi:integrase
MPKLNRPPKYCQIGKYAAVYLNGKPKYLGLHGSPESQTAYARLVAECRAKPAFVLARGEDGVTVAELAAAFLDHVKENADPTEYAHYRIVVLDFLAKLYGDIPVDQFGPSCLKTVRNEMILSGRFCRHSINRYMRRIAQIFTWGVEEEMVKPNTVAALKAVKTLAEGHPGTFDNDPREHVPDDVIRQTLPFLPPVLQAMVKVQRLTGCRPSEIYRMQAGEIDRDSSCGNPAEIF